MKPVRFRSLAGLGMMAFLTACTFPKQETATAPGGTSAPAAAPRPAAPPAGKLALNEGVDLYDQGDYNGAIKKLSGASEIWSADKAIQLTALKYMAFSYCVTSRQTQCRQQFEKALQLEPGFDLEPGERMHPLWGPVFVQAKKNMAKGSAAGSEKKAVKRKSIKPAQTKKPAEQ